MMRYSLLRLLVFFGCFFVLALVPVLAANKILLLVLAALLSLLVSWFLLKPFREQAAHQLQRRVETRRASHDAVGQADADAEDAESEGH